MKRYRPERNRQAGPLELVDVALLHDRGVSPAMWRHMLTNWSMNAETLPEQVFEQLSAKTEKLESLSPKMIAILHYLVSCGGRQRGETLRKEFLLRTLRDITPQLQQALDDGLIWPVPSSDQETLDHEWLIGQAMLLQVDLALPPNIFKALEDMDMSIVEMETIETVAGEQDESTQTSIEMLELNLLHLCDALQAETLKLNKSGAPNKRSLARFTTGIVLPGQSQPIDVLDAQNAEHLDYIALLLALGTALALLRIEQESVTADFEAMEEFFRQDIGPRNKLLEQALQNIKIWDEVLSHTIPDSPTQEQDIDAQLSLSRTNGQWLIGARGYLLSILRRAPLTGWIPQQDLIELCLQFDREYIESVLSNHVDISAAEYVHIFLTRMLGWTGIVELGLSEEQEPLIRLSPRGEQLVQVQDLPPHGQQPCLIVQPNFETMVFLDNASTQTLFKLYQIGERVGLADRVATFRLTSQSIQRGYSLGIEEHATIELLNALGHTPLDETIAFQLKDWARIWRQVTLYADGILLRHEDPDAFDLVVGQLKHEWRDQPIEMIRLSPGAAFVSKSDMDKLERMLTHNPSIIIDYLGNIPPCLTFVAPLTFTVRPAHCDIITFGLLDTVAQKQKDKSDRTNWTYELDLNLIVSRWPEDTLTHLLEFLRPRSLGGLPPDQEITLINLLANQQSATVHEELLVVQFENEHIAQLFSTMAQAQNFIEVRFGPQAFGVAKENEDLLRTLLDQLSLNVPR